MKKVLSCALTLFFVLYLGLAYSEAFISSADTVRDVDWMKDIRYTNHERALVHELYYHITGAQDIYELDDFAMSSDMTDFYFARNSAPIFPCLTLTFDPYCPSIETCTLDTWKEELNEKYEIIPLAYDALVFMVSDQNCAENISAGDLQRIYSGEIANWQTVNGTDEPIVAYQRGLNVFAQEMFRDTLMQGLTIAEPPVRYLIPDDDAFEELPMELGYNNAQNAIGYTMRHTLFGRYGMSNTKLLCVNGIAPTLQSIRTGEYPYRTTLYGIYPCSIPDNHPWRTLVSWMRGAEGQKILTQMGMVSLSDKIYMEPASIPEENRISCGTGNAADLFQNNIRELSRIDAEDTIPCTHFTSHEELTADELAMVSIEKWVTHAMEDLEIDEIKSDENDEYIKEFFYYRGFVSVYVGTTGRENTRLRTAVFDRNTGKKLSLSDLFPMGDNYIDQINRSLVITSMQQGPEVLGCFAFTEENLKHPFAGISRDYPYFIVSEEGKLCIAFSGDNPDVLVSYTPDLFLVETVCLP